MLKNVVKYEVMIENRLYQLFCESDAPTHHAKEFAFQFLKVLGQIEDQAKVVDETCKECSEEVKPETEACEPPEAS